MPQFVRKFVTSRHFPGLMLMKRNVPGKMWKFMSWMKEKILTIWASLRPYSILHLVSQTLQCVVGYFCSLPENCEILHYERQAIWISVRPLFQNFRQPPPPPISNTIRERERIQFTSKNTSESCFPDGQRSVLVSCISWVGCSVMFVCLQDCVWNTELHRSRGVAEERPQLRGGHLGNRLHHVSNCFPKKKANLRSRMKWSVCLSVCLFLSLSLSLTDALLHRVEGLSFCFALCFKMVKNSCNVNVQCLAKSCQND